MSLINNSKREFSFGKFKSYDLNIYSNATEENLFKSLKTNLE
jgi:hypothetical protein